MGFSRFLKVFHRVTGFAFLRFPSQPGQRLTPFINEKVPFNQHLIITKFDYSVRKNIYIWNVFATYFCCFRKSLQNLFALTSLYRALRKRKVVNCDWFCMLSNIVILTSSISDHCRAERTSQIRFLQGPGMTCVKCISCSKPAFLQAERRYYQLR